MVHEFRGRSHSSPSFSHSYSHNPYYTPKTEEELRKEREEEKKLQAEVARSNLNIPPELLEKHPNKSKQLWREFRRSILTYHGKDAVFALDKGFKDNTLSLGKLVGEGLNLNTATEIYQKWDEYWSYTNEIVQTHPFVPKSYPESESIVEIESEYIKEEIQQKVAQKLAIENLSVQAEQLYQAGEYKQAYSQFLIVADKKERAYPADYSSELNLAKCAIEIGKIDEASFLAEKLAKEGFALAETNYLRGRINEHQGMNYQAFECYERAFKAGSTEAKAGYERIEKILFPESTMPLEEYKLYMAKGGKAIKEGRAKEVFIPAETFSLQPGYSEDVEQDTNFKHSDKPSKAKTAEQAKKQFITEATNTQQLNVAELDNVGKLTEAVKRSASALPAEIAEELQALLSPATLATMISVFAVYIAAHSVGIGQAMDIGMLIAGGIFFGLDAFTIFKDIAGFANAVNAKTESDLDKAGQHLASAVAKIGVDAVMSLLTKKVADKVGKNIDESTQSDEVSPRRIEAEEVAPNKTPQTDVTEPQLTANSPKVRALPPELQGSVRVLVDENLNGGTVRTYYKPDIHLKVGSNATVADIQLHVPTIKILQRYQGLTGKVRALIERITNLIKRNGEPPVFSRAWEAKLELEKLPAIIEARQAKLASGDLDVNTRTQLEIEIADLESQIDRHARTLDEMDTNPGVGYVAAEGVSPSDAEDFGEIKKLMSPNDFQKIVLLAEGPSMLSIYHSVKEVTGQNRELSISLTAKLLKEIKTRSPSSPTQARQIATELLDPQSNWVASQTTKVGSQQQRLNEARDIGLPQLEKQLTQLKQTLSSLNHEIEALEKEVDIPQWQWSDYDLTSKDINQKQDKIRQLETEIEALKDEISQQQKQINSLQTEQSRERRIEHDEELKQKNQAREIQRQRAEQLRQQTNFPSNVTAEQAWQRLIATSSDDTSSSLWASVLIEQGIISSESDIITYLDTIKIQGQPVKKVRQQFKAHYRPKLFKIINSQSTAELKYQKMREIAESLDIREQGEFSEQWYLPRYGKRRDPFSSKPIDSSTQVTLDKTEATEKYGIELTTEKNRRFDEVYGDKDSATIREHKHITGKLGDREITQYRDNIRIIRHNNEIDNKIAQGTPLTNSKKDNPVILDKDGNRYKPQELVYTFATPEGVTANLKFMRIELKDNSEYLSFEIINSKGERKIIDIDNINELNQPALNQWLYPKK